MIGLVRRALRGWLPWLQFQELRREGFAAAWTRFPLQRPILSTPPIRTATTGPVELRVLTWRRDWVNLVWALKTYYHFAGVDYPLVIHDGGLLRWQADALRRHFPDARLVPAADADARFPVELRYRGLARSADYRSANVSTRKLFDFYLDSTADYVLTIDSDIVFFQRPDLLICPPGGWGRNWYNRDVGYWYSMSLDELEAAFGVRPPRYLNSGLAVVRRESIDYGAIEKYLAYPKLLADRWVTEQTLHALCSTVYGFEFLPDTYRVGGSGLTPDLVCKHYPGEYRPLLYTEGMRHLLNAGVIAALNRGERRVKPWTHWEYMTYGENGADRNESQDRTGKGRSL
jgi:hypothetical protein